MSFLNSNTNSHRPDRSDVLAKQTQIMPSYRAVLCSFDKTIKYDRSLDFACMLRKMQAGLPALLKDESADTIVNAALGVRLTTKQIAQVEMDAKVAWRIE